MPFAVEVAAGFDLDELVERFKLDVVAEDWVSDEGGRRRYVLVASDRILDSDLLKLVEEFAEAAHGSASVASMLEILEDPADPKRLELILSKSLYARWPLNPTEEFILDVSFQTRGVMADLGTKPRKSRKESEASHEQRLAVWFEDQRTRLYAEWDDFTLALEGEAHRIIEAHHGEVIRQWEDQPIEVSEARVLFPDSISFRIRMSGAGFGDLILNHPRIFEVQEPDEIGERLGVVDGIPTAEIAFELLPPRGDAPYVCVVDSGIQEGHRLLRPAMTMESSICLVPGKRANDVSDEVRDGGHGTGVAGMVLYPDDIPGTGREEARCKIGNARVLDEQRKLSRRLYAPSMLERIVAHFTGCRIFVHSINADAHCPLRHMSAWAAKIDELSYREDVLFIVSAGNLPSRQPVPGKGFLDHLNDGTEHPEYLLADSARIATPAQALQALSVGSIAHNDFDDGTWVSVANREEPSAFTRTGLGIWETLKPDVVEYGGDMCIPKNGNPTTATLKPDVCPHLVRSTLHGGPETGRDQAGTSFAAPKVAALATELQRMFPDQSPLLYRALIAQAARWPAWAENLPMEERNKAFRLIGFGRPDWARALSNSESRVTLITSEAFELKAGEAAIFEIPVPPELRAAGEEFKLRIDVTLSYATEPRRTRASLKGYQAVWLDWRSSRLRESMQDFIARMWTEEPARQAAPGPTAIPWILGTQGNQGQSRDVSRQGTLQKDWTTVPAFDLGESLGIAVRGHKGWNQGDPNATARFALAVSFEAQNAEVRVYEPVRVAVDRIAVEAARIRV